uniref:Uncharacterized protein n=1 Tax=Noccaea caerulescens TaxID=107243 RepID=A0A1J3FXY8_NOCCA
MRLRFRGYTPLGHVAQNINENETHKISNIPTCNLKHKQESNKQHMPLNQSLSLSLAHFGFLRTIMTESPRRNILLMKRSLLTASAFFLPFPVFGTSVHISLTFSRTMLQCLSNALTRPSSFLLFRQLINT